MAPDVLQHSPLVITPGRAAEMLHELYGISGVASHLPGDRDTNFLIESGDGRFMFKIANPQEDPKALQMQQAVLNHVRRWDPDIPVPQPVATADGDLIGAVSEGNDTAAVRLTTFLSGTTVEDTGWTAVLRSDVMATLARLGLVLRAFNLDRRGSTLFWDLERLPELATHTSHLTSRRRQRADVWLDHFAENVAPLLGGIRHQTIHADFNPANLIVDAARPDRLAGVIDFGDMTRGPLVADPAIAIAYQCLGAEDPASVMVESTARYHRTVPLSDVEARLVPELAITRLIQSVIISSWRASLHPDNRDYILIHAEPIWTALERLPLDDVAELAAAVEAACGCKTISEPSAAVAAARRRRSLGPGLRLSYDEPLHAASAEGVWITDTAGHRHLDAYNSVAHVGHGRAEVVNAISRQAARLNTNTRYLVDEVTRYAERVAALLPDPLDVVYFANSGSEANDLAWRIARTVTGRRGMIVTRHAYHGSTYLTMATSPEELGLGNIEPWVATVPAPKSQSAALGGFEQALARLETNGEQVAAFACDTVFSSDGIYEPPPGYLVAAFAAVEAAGGLCIADEVQAGFGRVGERFWGFAGHGVTPDIVTLGKPMGNGHPVAAVVTSSEIADEFTKSGYYFSTFAGNPVSAAAGQAVLDIIEREQLPQHADNLGEYLRGELRDLAASHSEIIDVRGPGLFVGVEMNDADRAIAVQNEMRDRRVLIGRTGPGGNVLKIRPPMVFAQHHADILLTTIDDVLSSY